MFHYNIPAWGLPLTNRGFVSTQKLGQNYQPDPAFLQMKKISLGIRSMRLDKYLKVSRLVKRRTVAAELCQGGHVKVNGQTAKPSVEVKPGNELQIRFGNRLLTVKVVQVPEKAVPAQLADTLYELISETALETSL
jgi:ribosomal 50S subunit-recycling heat shock protein